MIVLSVVNIVIYCFVVFRALQFFRPPLSSRRDVDQTIVAGIGMMSALLVFVLIAIVVGYPEMGPRGRGAMTLMHFFNIANAAVYVAIIKAVSRQSGACIGQRKRYFP